MAARDVFLSENNIDYLYRDVSHRVYLETGYDLNKNTSKYRRPFPGMMSKVYQNSPELQSNLSHLNIKASEKISNHFTNLIQKKNNYSAPMIDRPTRSFAKAPNPNEMNTQLEDIQKERQELNPQPKPLNNQKLPSQINNQELESSKEETNKKYQELLNSRRNQPLINPPQPSNPSNLKPQSRSLDSSPSQQQSQSSDFNILPYSINDDFNDQSTNLGQPLYVNTEELTDNTPEKVESRYKNIQRSRDQEIFEFLESQQGTQQNSVEGLTENFTNNNSEYSNNRQYLNNKPDRTQENSEYFQNRSNVEMDLSQKDRLDFNRSDIYMNNMVDRNPNLLRLKQTEEEKEKEIIEFEKASKLLAGNPLFDFFMGQIRDSKREYHDVAHYVVVSSEDRQWENGTENRYNFLVHFRPTGSQGGAGIDQLYRNIVSIEVLKVIFPHDRLSVPFDNRIYLDLQSYPFLVMDVDEIDGVFRGTNNKINEAFALLLFDKAFDSEVLTSDQITYDLSTTDNIKKRFDRQFKRGYMSFCPFLFEKKRYFNTPLASLNRLTIKFRRPDGQFISVDDDHLKIDSISNTLVSTSNLELSGTNGYPRTDWGQYIKITTTKFFSNRSFKIGDLIKIRNYTINSTDDNELKFQEFINREEGHVIINLDQEFTGESKNEGYINCMYIAPPGELDKNLGSLDRSTFYQPSPSVVSNQGDLINSSMQVHVTFKIVTREDKTTSVIKPINV